VKLAGTLLAATLAATAATAADDSPLARCAAMADATARLDCYDALAGRPAADAAPGDAFGLPPPPPPPEPDSVSARLVAAPKSWARGVAVKLDNGQTWKLTGDDRAYYPDLPADAEVVITKGVIGGYWLEVVPVRRRFKVKRIS
jgi:hypothetical protein